MSISISGISSGASVAPALDLPRMQQAKAVQQEVVRQFAATLPGNSGQSDYTAEDLKRAVADVERVSLTFNKKLQFVVDQKSHEVIVKVIDKDTDKVVKVLPPEELQRLHRKLKETIGFLFNETV